MKNSETKRCVIYARGKTSKNLNEQLERCKKYISAKGYRVDVFEGYIPTTYGQLSFVLGDVTGVVAGDYTGQLHFTIGLEDQ